jgi:hypothetical protein
MHLIDAPEVFDFFSRGKRQKGKGDDYLLLFSKIYLLSKNCVF